MFIRCLPNVFCTRSVEHMDKRHCNLSHVPDDVLRHQRTLEDLFLDSNQLRDLPKGLFRSTQLRRLTISDNEINCISPGIGNLHLLQEFDCSRNEIFELPEEIQFCQNLQVLDTSGNPLQNGLPSAITSLVNLSHLTLNDVSLTQLPENIGNLENLRCLEARENLLSTIPDSLCDISKLVTLDLGNNELIKLPNSIGQLSNLREMWLDVNEITVIPDEIAYLKRLQCLDLSSNKLCAMTEQIGELTSLTSLELSQNRLKRIPESIGRLKSLTVLKVDQNSLENLPDSIGWCTSLSELILTSNNLKDIPANIGHLKMLKHLNVDKNVIKCLPSSICNCSQLGILSLRFNLVEYLPEDIGNLKELRVLDLTSNRLHYLPNSLSSICSDLLDNQSSVSYSNQLVTCGTATNTTSEANLKAIWLSENQARPMVRLQQEMIQVDSDYDEPTGKTLKKILTCYLLPQTQFSTPSVENLSISAYHQAAIVPQLSKVPRSQSPADLTTERTGSVKFSMDVQADHEAEDCGGVPSRCATVLRRQNTPHPREFKAWKRRERNGRVSNGCIDDSIDCSAQPDDVSALNTQNGGTTCCADVPEANTANRKCTYRPITYCKNERIEDVIINKPNRFTALGLSIVGGSDQSSSSFPADNTTMTNLFDPATESGGIFIFKVQPGGLAERCGVKPGDRILSVNGINFDDVTHQEAVKALMNVSHKTLVLKIKRSECLGEPKNVCVDRDNENEPLGIKLNGGVGSRGVNPYDSEDDSIFITEVVKDGAAYRSGQIEVGQRILAINSHSLLGCRLEDALELLSGRNGCLKGGPLPVTLTVCQGYPPAPVGSSMCSNGTTSLLTVNDRKAYFESQIQRETMSDFKSAP